MSYELLVFKTEFENQIYDVLVVKEEFVQSDTSSAENVNMEVAVDSSMSSPGIDESLYYQNQNNGCGDTVFPS